MLIHRPEQVVGKYRGMDIVVRSESPTQDGKSFDDVCKAFGDRLMFINDAEKDK